MGSHKLAEQKREMVGSPTMLLNASPTSVTTVPGPAQAVPVAWPARAMRLARSRSNRLMSAGVVS